MATKTRRWEARVDAETDDLAAQAADRLGVSKSEFITSAARAEAERTLARADVTLMDDALFGVMLDSLDIPDPAPALARLAATPRPYSRIQVRG